MKIRLLVKLLLAVFVFTALSVPAFCEDDRTINVLCYHRFKQGKPSDFSEKQLDSYYIATTRFEEHLKFLKENGYNVISMADYLDFIDGKKELPGKPVIITIDDGYDSVMKLACPLLKKYGYTATIYVYLDYMSSGRHAMKTADLKQLKDEGFDIGSHSYSHPLLTSRKHGIKKSYSDVEYPGFLKKEIITSKKKMEQMLGFELGTMAYPFGAYSAEVIKFAKAAGFKAAFSVVPSYNTKETERYALKRTIIYKTTKTGQLKMILEKKPVKVKFVDPPDGDIITDAMPVLKAQLDSDSGLNTTTLRFYMGRVELKESKYDAQSRVLEYTYDRKLSKGVHIASVRAHGLDGAEHEYSWLFVVGKTADPAALEAAIK